jgi:hypothetical protein
MWNIRNVGTLVLAPSDTIDWAAAIYGSADRGGSRNRPRSQHDTGPRDATGRITSVLAIHYGTGLFSTCCYEPSYQQR